MKPKTRIAILISGRGSNMAALADAINEGLIANAEIAIVVSDKPDAGGLVAAKQRDIKTQVIERQGRTREEHDREIVAALTQERTDLVCLAGYMRVLSVYFLEHYRNRILNIHPSLLPSFPGLAPQQQALEHGVKFSGCTVHFVDETLDGGPIVSQQVVPLLNDDTEESLSARILAEEHKLYREAVALIASGHYEIVGRRVLAKI